MPLNVVFKGPVKSAKRAAARAGFNVAKCRPVNKRFGDVVCTAPCSAFTKVQRAYKKISIKAGRGAAPGDLLLFSYGSCERTDLRGAPQRRRRRR